MNTENLNIESSGISGLVKWLERKGHKVEPSDKKVFDLKVDGEYVEVKTKRGGWESFDFIGLTQNQFTAIQSGHLKKIYLVLNANNPENIDVIELHAGDLINSKYIVEETYYWYKSSIRQICDKNT